MTRASELIAKGQTLRWQKKFDEAKTVFEAARDQAIVEEGCGGPLVGDALVWLSIVLGLASPKDLAIRHQCLCLAEEGLAIETGARGTMSLRVAEALRVIGTHLRALGRPSEAFDRFSEATQVFDQLGDDGDVARWTRSDVVEVALELGRSADAASTAEAWIERIPTENSTFEQISANYLAGQAFLADNRPVQALPYLQEAVRLGSEVDLKQGGVASRFTAEMLNVLETARSRLPK